MLKTFTIWKNLIQDNITGHNNQNHSSLCFTTFLGQKSTFAPFTKWAVYNSKHTLFPVIYRLAVLLLCFLSTVGLYNASEGLWVWLGSSPTQTSLCCFFLDPSSCLYHPSS